MGTRPNAHTMAHGCIATRRPGQPLGFIIGGWGLAGSFPAGPVTKISSMVVPIVRYPS